MQRDARAVLRFNLRTVIILASCQPGRTVFSSRVQQRGSEERLDFELGAVRMVGRRSGDS